MTKFSAHLAITAAVFGIVYLILSSIPAFNQLDIFIEKWGWVVIIAVGLVVMAIQAIVTIFCVAWARNKKWEVSPTLSAFLGRIADYVCYALTLIASAALAPGLVSYTSADAVVSLAIILGMAASMVFWLEERLDLAPKTNEEMTTTRGKAYEIFCFVVVGVVILWVLYVLITVVMAWI